MKLDLLKCDSVLVQANAENTDFVPLEQVARKSATIIDKGNQFTITSPGLLITSPKLTERAEGIFSEVGSLPDGRKLLFVKRNGGYQLTGDNERYLLFMNCVDATKLI